MRWSDARCVLFLLIVGLSQALVAAQPPAETKAELARERQIIDRFLVVLERNPRRGTALDKIYGFHIENGSIEEFVIGLRERVEKKPEDGTGWMILGLVENQRGRDAAAVEALSKAKELRATDSLAAYYLGQSLVLVGQPEKAAAAFEEAIERKPAQADLLEIFQALGRVHQRAQRTKEALEVWSRLEKLFPGDARVQEQIALTLVEEGQSAEALPRYETLAKATTDDYRRTVYRMEAAELKVKLSRAKEGIADLEQLLAKLNPESWLFREVRRKIEEVFLRTDDQDGLAKYYASWLEKNNEDIEAMARLARVLARQARVPEAQEWLNKALKLAPSRKELRLAFIEQLVDDQRFTEALQQYVELAKADPNNPDFLRDWGKLVLRDTSRPKEERQVEAERIWRRLLAARPTDPLVATQVADLFRNADMQPQALALYQKAVELAPTSPQYLEYLGEFYHILKRTDEALATWRKMAEGNQRTATNLSRLAEVLAQFGYLKDALPEIAAACELDPKDFALALKAADLEIRAESYDTALASLSKAEKLSQNDEEHEAVLNQQLKTYTLQNKLGDLANDLTVKAAGGSASHQDWFLLARYREALHEYPEANRAIGEAIKLLPNDIRSLASASRIAEQSGDLKVAADLNRKLAVVDRRGRSDYLQHVASLETQLGRVEEALAAGNELIAASPGNVETYQFFADLCFRLGRTEDGLTALRRATRVNPNEPQLLLALASALAGQFRSDEAIELYWQAFEKGKALDDKLSMIGKLTDLYLQTNHFDQLLERLERGRREADQRREMTICLAQAYQSAGDYGMSRQELERLLSENTRDTTLLLQLSKLAESESDLASAVKYQEQLAKLAPGHEAEFRLATLLSRNGDHQEAAELMVRLAVKENDRGKLLRNIDGLLTNGQEETALSILEPKLRENPTDWELLYRHGTALAKRGSADAARSFQALLSKSLSDEERSAAARGMQQRSLSATAATATPTTAPAYLSGPLNRLTYAAYARVLAGLDPNQYLLSPTSRGVSWTPQSFGQVRMVALGWLYRLASNQQKGEEFVAEMRKRIEGPNASVRDLWDWLYLQSMRSDLADMRPVARRLAEMGDLAGQAEYLQLSLTLTTAALVRGGTRPDDALDALEPGELDLLVRSLRAVQRVTDEASLSVAFRYYSALMSELRRAGRADEANRLYQDLIAQTDSPRQIYSAMQVAAEREDMPTVLALFHRLGKKSLQARDMRPAAASDRALLANVVQRIASGKSIQPDESLTLLDHFLDYHTSWANQRRDNPLSRLAASGPSARTVATSTISVGGVLRRVSMTYPTANAYYDTYAISVLRSIFEQFKQRDVIGDLQQHLEQRAAKATGEKIYDTLAVAYVQAWSEDQDAALKTLGHAIELAPNDADLRLDTARLCIQAEQLDEALAHVDAVKPLDQRTLQEREKLALDLAVRLGDHNRAREAAQRLFGLRLDPETQVNLAGQMRRLGMTSEANAVLARSQRQAGSRVSALAALMAQYQSQGENDQAAQVAQRILRSTRALNTAQAMTSSMVADQQYRTQAIQCLNQTGKLQSLIAGLEEQIRRTPTATQLYELLSEYYQAAGQTQKGIDLIAKLVEMKPDDAEMRNRFAQDLYRRGKLVEACEQYKIILKKQPQIISRRFVEVMQAFQRAGKEPELAQLLMEIDLKPLGPSIVLNMLSGRITGAGGPGGQLSTTGMALFKRAWEAFPDQRMRLLTYVGDEMWRLPEAIEYAKQSLRPMADVTRRDPWYGISSGGMSFGPNNQINTAVGRMLTAAARYKRLDDLRDEIAKAADEDRRWLAGPVLLAVIDVRQKKPIDAAAVARPLLAATGSDYGLMYSRWLLGLELEGVPEYRDVAAELFKAAATNGRTSWSQFQYSPTASLMEIYKRQGRKEEARDFLRQYVRAEMDGSAVNSLPSSMRVDSILNIAKLLDELDAPAEAVRIYRDLLTNPTFADGPQRTIIINGQPADYRQQAQQGLIGVLAKRGTRPSDVVSLLTPQEKQRPGAPVIDLMLDVSATSGTPLKPLESPVIRVRTGGAAYGNEGREQIWAHLKSLAASYPRDLSVRIAAAMFALNWADAAFIEDALARLSELVESTPLEALGPRQRPNSRQRTEAGQQVALWLVARECLKTPARRELAEKLADRAVTAAQRQIDVTQVNSILYERGKLALEAGDTAAAERHWNELIDVAVVQPRAARAQSSTRSGALPATMSQFTLATTVASAAAEKELVGVSLRAIGEALSGGLPVQDLPASGSAASRLRSTSSTTSSGFIGGTGFVGGPGSPPGSPDRQQRSIAEMTVRMRQLSATWKQHQFPPANVSQVFERLVFPPNRPGEIVFFEIKPLTSSARPVAPTTNVLSIDRMLIDWAIRADRGEELKREVAARQATPTDITRGHLLLCQFYIERREPELARPHLEALRPTLDKAKLTVLEQQINQASTPATPPPAAPKKASPPPATASKTNTTPPAPQPAQPPNSAATSSTASPLESQWSDLEKTEAVAARALLQMADKPKECIAFLKDRLKPLNITADRVQTLLANLGSDNEKTWTTAYEELEYFDPRLAIDLETLMADVTTSPTRQRMVEVLSGRSRGSLEGRDITLRRTGGDSFNFAAQLSPNGGLGSWWAESRVDRLNMGSTIKRKWTQAVRAIILLEHIGTPDAVAILQDMASGHPDAQPTKIAAEALERRNTMPK